MQFRSRAQSGIDPGPHGSISQEVADPPPSAAWLAAQQAFPGHQRAFTTPVVVFRKGRASGRASIAEVRATTPAPVTAEKAARVFRIASMPTASSSAAPPQRAESGWQCDPQGSAQLQRKRRVAIEKRPGPVLYVDQASPGVGAMAAVADQEAPMSKDRVDALAAMLADVDVLLDDAARARSLRFLDTDFARTWERLSCAAQDIQAQIERIAT